MLTGKDGRNRLPFRGPVPVHVPVKKKDCKLAISPAATDLLEIGDVILVIAETEKLRELEKV
jgi:Trk K+ transport system NAD-binding subunit